MFNLSRISSLCRSKIPLIFTQQAELNPLMFTSLSANIAFFFTRNSKPVKRPKVYEKKTGIALSDEKGAKLAKEEEAEEKKRKIEAEKRRIERSKIKKIPLKTFDQSFELKMSQLQLDNLAVEQSHKVSGISVASKMRRALDEKRKNKKETKTEAYLKIVKEKLEASLPLDQILPNPNNFVAVETPKLKKKVVEHFFNSEEIVNQQFKNVKLIPTPPDDSIRTGVIARKIGMTGTWDRWGKRIALTVLQVDRCQVVQVKTKEHDGICALQLGAGQKSLKRLKKPDIGHFLKHGLPPKEYLYQFNITPENILPPGYQLGARHFTPGQYVDVSGISNGKGFQGTVKKYHFKMQPATHGCSLSHRAMGSTGQRTDPGKVYKKKKMPGRMGGEKRTVQNLKVYKIDYERSLIYVTGAVPGRRGNFLQIKDAYKKVDQNEEYLNYPTFVPEKSKLYAEEMIMEAPEEDPEEINSHDNIVVKETGGEEE